MSKKIVSILTAIALVVSCMNFVPSTVEAAVNSSSGSSSWSLVWNDEFNQTVGGALDTSTWSYDMGHGASGWGNNELQRYTNSTNNVRIADMSSDSGSTDGRALAITAKRENGEITSGRIKTLNKQYMKYGRIEARIRLDDGMRSGVWPAFWMMGNDIESGASWPYCGEIDIMEHRNAENHVISTLHWNTGTGTGANYAHVYAGSETTNQFGNIDSINNWHNYAVEWYEDVMKFYLDGVCFETLNINSSEMEEFQKEHFILLNLAIGSKNSPFTLGQTVSDDFQSATMYVDYVRVYQGNDSAFSIAKSGTSETKPTQTTTGDGFTTCSGEKTSLGGWGYYVLSGNAGKYQNGTNLDDEFVLKLTSNNKSAWGVQAFTKNISVTSGHKYNVSVDVNSSAATGDVLMKDEVGGTEFTNQALSAGNNTLTGSFTADSDTMQFMFNLANVDAGTTLKFSNVKVTDVTGSGEVEVTTTASGDSSWEVIGGGDANTWYYDKNSMSGISGVVNIQQPGFAKEMGIYINVPAGISSVSVNGNTEGVAAIQGAGVVVYLSALTKQKNTVTINYAGGTGTVIIKNTNGTSDDTTTEAPTTTTEAPTTTTQAPTTTTQAPTQQGVTTSEDIQVLGYQISTTYEGIRTAAMVEPTINSQAVKSWGFVYGLENYNDTNTNITDTDMVVGSTNKFINSYQSTSAGTIGVKLGDSDTATYYARTMSFGKKSVSAFNAKYKVRAYAVLADGSYVYSAVTSYSISEVADYLYKNVLMNTVEAHTYLYENILSKVYNGYTQVDFQWNNTIIKPDQVTE